MDYVAIYHRLMERARARSLSGYVERHHIRPKCLGGSDHVSNMVRLTPEEHYVAHQLLVKMCPTNMKLLRAAVMMTSSTRRHQRGNKLYGWLRRQFAARMSEELTGSKRGPHSAETKAKMSAASKGRKKSEAHCAAMTASKTGKKRGPHSEIHKRNLSDSLRNSASLKTSIRAFSGSPEYRAKQSAITTAIWARRRAEEASRTIVN
jgi:hypothetical protein